MFVWVHVCAYHFTDSEYGFVLCDARTNAAATTCLQVEADFKSSDSVKQQNYQKGAL